MGYTLEQIRASRIVPANKRGAYRFPPSTIIRYRFPFSLDPVLSPEDS